MMRSSSALWTRSLRSSTVVARRTFSARPPNPFIKQIMKQGMPSLEACTADVMQHTKEPLLFVNPGPSPAQLNEAARICDVVTMVVEQIAAKSGEFCIQEAPIVILDAEVSPNCRQARVFWCIPLHLCDLPDSVTDVVTEKMQQVLVKRGPKIQSHVFGRLSHYYPPQIRFVPIPVKVALSDFLSA